MKDAFFAGLKNCIPSSLKLWTAFGSRFSVGFLFIYFELFKKSADIVSFVNDALALYWFVLGLVAVCAIPAALVRIFEEVSKRNLPDVRRRVFILIFTPLEVWYSDIIGVLMYISGIYAGHAFITEEWLSAGYSVVTAFSSFFLYNYIEKNTACLATPQPLGRPLED